MKFIPNCYIALPSVCEIEINRKNINPSVSNLQWCSKYLYLLINCVNVCSIYFNDVQSNLLGVRSSLSESQLYFWSFFGALGSRLVCLMVSPAMNR